MKRFNKYRAQLLVIISLVVLIRALIQINLNGYNNISINGEVHFLSSNNYSIDNLLIEKERDEFNYKILDCGTYNLVGFINLIAVIFLVIYLYKQVILDLRQKMRYIMTGYFSGGKYKEFSTNF